MAPNKPELIKSTMRKVFIKREKLLKQKGDDVSDYTPRVVSGTCDLANCLLGPWIQAFQKKLTRIWDSTFPIWYTGACNALELGKIGHLFNVAGFLYENDFSRFDASISSFALDFEIEIYKHFGIYGDALAVLLAQGTARSFTHFGYQFDKIAGRNSGDPNTSLGNALLNALVTFMVYKSLAARFGYTLLFDTSDFQMVVNGDDSIVRCRYDFPLDLIEQEFLKYGFKAKSKKRATIWDVEYCSGRFYPCRDSNGDTFVWAQKLGRFLAKNGVSASPFNTEKQALEWYKGVLTCANCDFHHIPVAHEYIRHALQLLGRVKAAPSVSDYRPHAPSKFYSTESTYAFMSHVYGLSIDDIRAFEEYNSSITDVTAILDHYVLDMIMEVDL
jgi:hypothetical protein